MFSLVEALFYRSLFYTRRELSGFQVLVGPNASGKSTFLDTLSFLSDFLVIGLGPAIEKRAPDIQTLCWMHETSHFELAVEARIPIQLRTTSKPTSGYEHVRYELALGINGKPTAVQILEENLWLIPDQSQEQMETQPSLFPSHVEAPETILSSRVPHRAKWLRVVNKAEAAKRDYFRSETTDFNMPFNLGPRRSALANLPEDEDMFPVATWFRRQLREGVQKLVLDSAAMRRPSPPGLPEIFQVDGSNLPWAVGRLRQTDNPRFHAWLRQVQTIFPDLKSINTVERDEDRHSYLELEFISGLKAPSWLISDGTLRILALTLLAYIPEISGTFLIEEPENGIHPLAIDAVIECLSSVYDAQILLATHSPLVVSLVEPKSVLCFSRDEAGATTILSGTEHPRLAEWTRESDLGTLFASGVLG